MAHVVDGNRGGKILIFNNSRFRRNQTRQTGIYWKCDAERCQSRIKTNLFDVNNPLAIINIISSTPHAGHGNPDENIERSRLVRQMREEIRNDPTRTIRSVYDRVVLRAGPGVNPFIPSFQSVRSVLNRERAKHVPPVPRNLAQVNINGLWALTQNQQQYLRHQNNGSGVLIFATDEDLQLLANATMVFVDGTFKTAPRPYEQFFTIHGEINGHILHLASGLLANKNAQSYAEVFRTLANDIQRLTGQPWVVREMVTDFEAAIMNAATQIFPGIRIKGCYFHFTKAVYRRIKKLGLARAYERDQALQRFVQKVMAMGFLPLNILRANWRNLQQAPNTVALLQQYQRLNRFVRYFSRNWMNPNGIFRPMRWNVYMRPMEYRTNNAVEAFNRAWNWFVGVRHPSLWVFLTKLRQQKALQEVATTNMLNGLPPPRRRRNWRILEDRIERVKDQYRRGHRNLDQYWNAVMHLIQIHR